LAGNTSNFADRHQSHPIISETIGSIFTKLSKLVEEWGASLSVHSFWNRSRDVAMAINLVVKFAKLADPTLIRRIRIPKGFRISQRRWAP